MDIKQTRAAWWGTVVLFLVHGLVVATWISRIPAVQSALHLSNFVLGLTLLSSAIGALCTIPVTGMLVGKYGSKRVSRIASTGFCFCLILPALATNAVTLGAALFIYGAWAAAMGVGMNSQAVDVENAIQRPTMSRFHGMFSLGAMIGAAIGGAVAARGFGIVGHFAISGLLNALAVLVASRVLLETHDAHKNVDHRLPFNKMPRVLLALSAIAFCMFLSEGAMADWIALYMRQVLKAGQGTAALGYSVFSAAMATMRFLGDIVTARIWAVSSGAQREFTGRDRRELGAVHERTALGNAGVRIGGLWILDYCAAGFWIGRAGERRFARRWHRHGFGHRLLGVYCRTTGHRIFVADDDAAGGAVGSGGMLLDFSGALYGNETSVTETNRFAITCHF